MSCAENHGVCGAIIFRSTDENDLLALQRFVSAELIRFGQTSPLFHPSPEYQAVFLLEKIGLYLKGGVPWAYPYEKVHSIFPNIGIKVYYPSVNQPEWDSISFGNSATPELFASLEDKLVEDHLLPLKRTPATTNVSAVLEAKSTGSFDSEISSEGENGLPGKIPSIETDTDSVAVDPQIERTEHIHKIKDLTRNDQEALALQLVRSLNDPKIYETLLRDCCETSGKDESEDESDGELEDEDTEDSEPSQLQEDINTVDSSSPLTEQPESVEEKQQNGHNVYLFDDVMLDAGKDSVEIQNELKTEPTLGGIDTASPSNHTAEKMEPVGQGQRNNQTAGVIEEVMSKGKREESPEMLSITELSLDDQPAQQKQKLTQKMSVSELSLDGQPVTQKQESTSKMSVSELSLDNQPVTQVELVVTEEAVSEEAVTEEAVTEEKISPLIMNTWFHSLDEATHHPKAVSKLDIIHQETLENLNVLSRFPYLEELHFIKVNIDSFEGLNSAPRLCHIKFDSCEISGWMGLLDLQGLEKIGCYPDAPPEKVKRLLEENGVEIYLFTPTRINGSKASNTVESIPETQTICEETLA